ncbi:MAG: nitrite/sulfite reductase [Chloroflexi bacterium]|nr:nitrite/sulfite reductase [Chloroflexota bacterium]
MATLRRQYEGILPPSLEEIDNFQAQVIKYRMGEADPMEFRPFRLQHGIYGQRQPENQMVRVKLPFGGVTAKQLEYFAVIAEQYSGTVRGHVTTRQNFQFHFVPLDSVPEIMNGLAQVGLTTREACGNTVRNVTACPYAGVARGETFDVTPYAAAYARFFLRRPENQNLPRKWKTAFSGCVDGSHGVNGDCALTAIHDIGFIARIREVDGVPLRGFSIVVGGGTSTMARKAEVLYDFIPADHGEYLRISAAALAVFNRDGQRKNRNQARIKWLIRKIGWDEFRRRVAEELTQPWAQEFQVDMPELMDLDEEEVGEVVPLEGDLPPGYARWRLTNVHPQQQRGFFAASITLPLGDLSPAQFRQVAEITRRFSGGRARTNIQQNIVLRHVREESLPALYTALAEIGLGEAGANTITDVVSCPGTDSCSLAIASSRGLGRALARHLKANGSFDPDVEKITIKMSGCPNGCGQHHVGAIGFSGASSKQHGREVPTAELWLGGGVTDKGFRYGTLAGKVPTKHAPQLIDRLLTIYQAERQQGEPFQDFVERVGAKALGARALEGLTTVLPPDQEPDAYMDWGSTQLFEVVRGEGECAV